MVLQQLSYRSFFLITAFFITLIRLLNLYFTDVPLWVDEAQYWLWSKNLDFGYYSKPPIIAWIIGLSTNLFGDNEFGIRLFSPIIHFLVSIITYHISLKCFNDGKIAFFSAVSYLILPAVSFSSSFISADAPLMFFWALGVYIFISINQTPKEYNFTYWLLLAICYGFGMLSKYTFVAFVFSVCLYFLMNRSTKLFTLNFLGSAILSIIIFTPNFLWNYNNNFVSFAHTSENVASKSINIYPIDMLEFIGGQFLVFGVIMTAFLLPAIFQKTAKRKVAFYEYSFEPVKILNYITIPVLFVGILTSLFASAQAHWAAPAYITGNILVVSYLLKTKKEKWLTTSLILHLFIFLVFLFLSPIVNLINPKIDPLNRAKIWHKPAEYIKKNHYDSKDTLYLTDERKIIAPLIYDLKSIGFEARVKKWNPGNRVKDHYDMNYSYNNEDYKSIYFITRSVNEEYLQNNFSEYFLEKILDKKKGLKIYKIEK